MRKKFGIGMAAKAAGSTLALTLSFSTFSTQTASASTWIQPLKNAGSNLCIGVDGGSPYDGALTLQWECNGNPDQTWFWVPTNGGYELQNGNKKCLEAPGWTTAAGARLGQWSCHGGANQIWNINDFDNSGRRRVKNANSGLCISNQGGSGEWGNHIIQWQCNTAPDQYWDASGTISIP
ncbi:RICIN domain-containing protein [Kitasatospora sp. NPDC056138]|uniref:RICIN domain-containing protein n=1 Tax=Kitasatospora sp. NPDC056138 TaxID=3345724 RepID=UPI0035E0BE77